MVNSGHSIGENREFLFNMAHYALEFDVTFRDAKQVNILLFLFSQFCNFHATEYARQLGILRFFIGRNIRFTYNTPEIL